jgi:hypothetical protein
MEGAVLLEQSLGFHGIGEYDPRSFEVHRRRKRINYSS